MKILNAKEMIKNKTAYPCYSIKLYKFLFCEKGIYPIDSFTNKSTGKECWLFAKSDKLQEYLDEWSKGKKGGEVK